MGNSKLVFKISPKGELTVEGEGFSGGNCLKAAEQYLQALGRVESQTLKPEFHMSDGQHVIINN